MNIDISKLKKIASGFTADVYQLDETKVLKLYYEGWEKICIENEYHVDLLINSYSIKAPKTYEMVQAGNRTGIIFQKLQNTTMKDMISQNKKNSLYYAKILAREHFKINSILDEQHGLLPQKDAYQEIISSRTSLNKQQKEKLLHLLEELPSDNRICHGDFHPLNLLFESDDIYIIDWVGALSGNPLADVAGSYMIIKLMGTETKKPAGFLKNIYSRIGINSFANTYLKEYLTVSNYSRKELYEWIPIRAATYLDFGLPDHVNKKLQHMIDQSLQHI
ncbi:MAG TPA: aminoglycoside phosphotransferase family protein [Lachnospiraceae bacterium]|nr:aminoglycoside phosphotransferase family protein [Lachnospiraceae bacterium]